VYSLSKPHKMTPVNQSVRRGLGGRRYLSSERERRLGVCFWFRLFNVAPETTARFSYLDDRSRSQSPPCVGTPSGRSGRSGQSTCARPAGRQGRTPRWPSGRSPWWPGPPPAPGRGP
jgi:hypothetical protein